MPEKKELLDTLREHGEVKFTSGNGWMKITRIPVAWNKHDEYSIDSMQFLDNGESLHQKRLHVSLENMVLYLESFLTE